MKTLDEALGEKKGLRLEREGGCLCAADKLLFRDKASTAS